MENTNKIPSVMDLAEKYNVSEFTAALAVIESSNKFITENPDKAWRMIPEGAIVPIKYAEEVLSNNISPVIYDIETTGSGVLGLVENIIEVSDEDILLYDTNTIPDSCAGGFRVLDDPDGKKNSIIYNSFTMLRGQNYCIFIDCDGYKYSRLVGVLECNYKQMYADIIDEETNKAIDEQHRKDIEEAKEILEYGRRCARWESVMSSIEDGEEQRKAKATQRKNVLAMLHSYFPGQKFSVTYEICWSHTLKIKWIDGPTEEEVLATDIDLFQRGTIHFDGMTDSTEIEEMKNSNFAREYALYINDIELNREMSEQTKSELEADVESVWPDGVYDGALVADNPQLYKTVEALGFSPNEICFDWLYKETITRKLFDRLSMYV